MDDETSLLAQVLHDHGERWQIQADADIGAWTAVERPTPTALHVLVAHDLDTLRAKLIKAT